MKSPFPEIEERNKLTHEDKRLLTELVFEALNIKKRGLSWEEVRHELQMKYTLTEPNPSKVFAIGKYVCQSNLVFSIAFDEYVKQNREVVKKYEKVCPELTVLLR